HAGIENLAANHNTNQKAYDQPNIENETDGCVDLPESDLLVDQGGFGPDSNVPGQSLLQGIAHDGQDSARFNLHNAQFDAAGCRPGSLLVGEKLEEVALGHNDGTVIVEVGSQQERSDDVHPLSSQLRLDAGLQRTEEIFRSRIDQCSILFIQ